MIKKKSLVVAFISSFVIACVLVLTLVGYAMYMELKAREISLSYHDLLQRVNAKAYAKYLLISKLEARIETQGVLKGKPVIDGIVENKGGKGVTDILLKVKFLDTDNAVIYEEVFRPQEPSLGGATLAQIAIPYLYNPPKAVIKPGEILHFKKILENCPSEIFRELKQGKGFAKSYSRWSGRFVSEVLSVTF